MRFMNSLLCHLGSMVLLAVTGLTSISGVNAGVISAIELKNATDVSSVRGNDGFFFSPKKQIKITRVGYYDSLGDGLYSSHSIAISKLGNTVTGDQFKAPFDPEHPGPDDFIEYDQDGNVINYFPYFEEGFIRHFESERMVDATLNAGDGELVGRFRYIDVTPVVLNPGELYSVTGFHPGGGLDKIGFSGYPNGFAVDSSLSYLGYGSNFRSQLFPVDYFASQLDNYRFIENGVEFTDSFSFSPGLSLYLGPNFQFSTVPEPSSFIVMLGFCSFLVTNRRRYRTSAIG